MKINKIAEAEKLILILEGRLDTTTSPEVEKIVQEELSQIKELVFDFKDLDYISSAGLRVLLKAQKTMNKQGKMTVRNINEMVRSVFEISGLDTVLEIE